MKYNYYYLNHESCFPQRTVLHSFYTCFIATASNLLQIALSYIRNKTNEEKQLHQLLKLVLLRGSTEDQLIFLNNMQCFILNPILGLNERNKYMILKNIPIVKEFNIKMSLMDVIRYNINVISKSYSEEEGLILESKIITIINKLSIYEKFIKCVIRSIPEKFQHLFIELDNEIEILDFDLLRQQVKDNDIKIRFNRKSLLYLEYADVERIMNTFINKLHECIIGINELFIETISIHNWKETPYLFDIVNTFDPLKMMFRINEDASNTLDKIGLRLKWKVTEKVIDVPSFIYLLIEDNRQPIYFYNSFKRIYSFRKISAYYRKFHDYNGSFNLPNIRFLYNFNFASIKFDSLPSYSITENISTPMFVKRTDVKYIKNASIVAEAKFNGSHWNTEINNKTKYVIDDVKTDNEINSSLSIVSIEAIPDEKHNNLFYIDEYETIESENENICLIVPDEIMEMKHIKINGGFFCSLIIIVIIFVTILFIIVLTITINKINTCNIK